MVQIQREHLADIDTFRTAESWARDLIEQLLCLTHRQWLLCNALLHFRLPDGRTYAKRERLVEKFMDLMWTDPDDLLPEDRALMTEDYKRLAKADATDQAYWIAETEVAIKAAQFAHDREHTRNIGTRAQSATTISQDHHDKIDPEIDTKGSMRYRQRRRQ